MFRNPAQSYTISNNTNFSCQHLDLNFSQKDLQNLLKNLSMDNVFMTKIKILNGDFALAGEIIHDHKFSFYAIGFT